LNAQGKSQALFYRLKPKLFGFNKSSLGEEAPQRKEDDNGTDEEDAQGNGHRGRKGRTDY
jgi:hypothetical protein